MQGLRLRDSISSVTLLQQDADGKVTPIVLHENVKKKPRKTTRGLAIVEKLLLEAMDTQKTVTDSYRRRFKDSSRDKRDGWMMDMPANVYKAVRDGVRGISLERVV